MPCGEFSVLDSIIEWHGKPIGIRVDNWSDNASAALKAWMTKRSIGIFYIQAPNMGVDGITPSMSRREA